MNNEVYDELRITVAQKKLQLALRALELLIAAIQVSQDKLPDTVVFAINDANRAFAQLSETSSNLHK